MHKFGGRFAACAILALALSACGGGGSGGGSGGGVVSTPAPSPTPSPSPAATNTDVGNLKASQTFETTAAQHEVNFELTGSTTTTSSAGRSPLSIAFNSANGSYTVSTGGNSVTFGTADEQNTGYPGERRFSKLVGGQSEHLTLVNIGYGSDLETNSVGLGFWQSNSVSGASQDTQFSVFVYGFPTRTAEIPVTGTASYRTDVFGFATPQGAEPLSFSGTGTLAVDFANANFRLDAEVYEYYLVNGNVLSAPKFTAAGKIGSSSKLNGTFFFARPGDAMSGTLTGEFFGPNAREVGGVFNGTGQPGSAVTGGFTASREGAAANMTLDSLTPNTSLYGSRALLSTLRYASPPNTGSEISTIYQNSPVTYSPPGSVYWFSGLIGNFEPGDLVSSTAEADIYEITPGDDLYRLTVYKPDGVEGIELTYSTFFNHEHYPFGGTQLERIDRSWITAGLLTPEGTLFARTGSARYNGVALGNASTTDAARQFSVSGTSQFDINFGKESFAGWVELSGSDLVDGSNIDFGRFNLISGTGFTQVGFHTGFVLPNSELSSEIAMQFYGPDAEELGGSFRIYTDTDYVIVGSTIAKRQ